MGSLAFRRTGSLAKAMVILLAVIAAFEVIDIPAKFALRRKAHRFVTGSITEDAFRDALRRQGTIAGLQGAAVIAVIVLTMVWMYRLALNHRVLGRPDSTWAPGWAIGGWFVPPFAIYAVPWLMLTELWRGSDPANTPNDPAWKRRSSTPLLVVWWILYGFVPILGLVAFTTIGFGNVPVNNVEDYARRLDDYFALQFALSLVSVASAAIFAKIVHDLSLRQGRLTGER